MTHAGIDGFSRLIVFMHCSDNNRASTVYEHFLEATTMHGLPSRVRTDQGRENMMVARHMLEHRGLHRGSIITGSSIHNQRIERLWKDVFCSVIGVYYRLFYYMEGEGILNPLNEVHLFAIHYVFLPRINRSLKIFVDSWNHHSLRTEGNHTPHQLFTSGVLALRNAGMVALDFLSNVNDNYGVDEGQLTANPNEDLTVPPIDTAQLTQSQLTTLQQTVDPLAASDNYGIEI